MPPTRFRLSQLPIVDCPPRLNAKNATVANVPEAFGAISSIGDPLGIRDGNHFPLYAYTQMEIRGVNEPKNHFHGIQRLGKGNYFAVSGGVVTGGRRSHIFIAKIASHTIGGPRGSNLLASADPPKKDSVVACYGLDTFRWRAGGMSVLGDVLVVPLEGRKRSRVVFLHTRKPEAVERFKVQIDRPNFPNAEAAGLVRLNDGRFLCAVWREVKGRYPGRVDFYLSKDEDFGNGFHLRPLTWPFVGLDQSGRNPKYQNVNFVVEQKSSGQTQLYLIGTENGSRTAPLQNAPNYADLWRVELPASIVTGGHSGKTPILSHVTTAEFHGVRDYCNFDAGAGLHIDSSGSLHLYSCYHWRVDNTIRISEFASHKPGTVHDIKDAWIELYEHDEFRGKRLNLYGDRTASISDYSKIFVAGGDFDDTISSAKFHIPKGYSYRLYRDANYKEEKQWKKAFVDLKGTGSVVSVPDLKDKPYRFGDRVSSSRYVTPGGKAVRR